jgi:hypothetical protein
MRFVEAIHQANSSGFFRNRPKVPAKSAEENHLQKA